jgi:hypothetical protein
LSKFGRLCISGLALAAIAVGCGDGNGDEGSGDASAGQAGAESASLSKGAFDQQAEAICERGRNRVLQNLADYQKENGALSPRDIGADAVSVTFLPVFREEVDELSQLEAPPGDEKQIAALLAERRRALDEIEQKGLSSNLELAEALKRSDRMMLGYGLESCTFS